MNPREDHPSIALLPGTGLGDTLLFLPTLWRLLQMKCRVSLFSSSLTPFQKRLPQLYLAPTARHALPKQALEGYHYLFIQEGSPAIERSECSDRVIWVGARRWQGLRQGEQIAHDIACHLPLPPYSKHQFHSWLSGSLGFTFQAKTDRSPIVIHPGGSSPRKRWPLSQFIALAEQLRRHYPLVFCLGPGEQQLKPHLSQFTLWSDLPLNQLCHHLSGARLVISSDTGVSHLSSLIGTPTLTLFGSRRHAKLWRPLGEEGRIVCPLIPLPGFLRPTLWKKSLFSWQVLRCAYHMLRSQCPQTFHSP